MLKVGIIGISGYGEIHYNNLMRKVISSDLKIVAAVVINQEDEKEKCKTLKEHGCRIFTDYHEMFTAFAGKLDLVCIPTGINMHAPMAIAAMHAGADVLIEKPAAASIQEVNLMRECEKLTGKQVYVGFQHIYQKSIQDAKRMILSGKLGKLKTIKCLALSPRNNLYYNRNKWAGCLKFSAGWILDSPFNNATAHYLNVALFWGGNEFENSAKISSCEAELYCANKIDSPDTAAIKLRTIEGVDIYYYCSHAVKKNIGPKLEVICEQGTLYFDTSGISISYNNNAKIERLDNFDDLINDMFNSLINHTKGSKDFVCGLEIAGQHTLVVNAVHDASRVEYISNKYIYHDKRNQQITTCVTGLDKLLLDCFESCKMPYDFDVEWTCSSPAILLENYHEFAGNKID